ncbi:MAG: hypothetical protein GYB66_12295 [Chloroflexi bacterium]|nr:hypothetical protein [Chloroflexota bacterium]
MGIDYVIDYACIPKQRLTTEGLVDRLKDRARAQEVVAIYREQGDHRPANEIGFEVTRRSANGMEVTDLLIAGEVLDEAAILDELEHHCVGCPANAAGRPYGCLGTISYPISREAEIWLLEQLPGIAEPILFLMLMRGVQEFGYTGDQARELRDYEGIYFEASDTLARRYAEMDVTADVLFEMTFQLGPIKPPHAVMLLLFYHAIPRDNLDPDKIMQLTRGEIASEEFVAQYSFLHSPAPDDSTSIRDYKQFLLALYTAYTLDVALLLDI